MEPTLDELEKAITGLKLQAIIQKAYEQGVEDGRSKFSIPLILTRTEAMDFLKCGATLMAELMSRPDFPVNREFGVKIPTHLLMKWIEKNTQWVEDHTSYFEKEAIG
ncbi:hypothetical protein [Metabacillus idriensis]|uniref:hypothetical protein n=1 Tax=Metabacillus idriensis TaxID=324768 RepID=UPI0017492C47|nr:hypothetical protein [Metabacillus idriensis]